MSDTINIYRRRQADPFARIPHTLLCDPALTWKAKGILCYLLSKPDYWQARERDIEQRGADGSTAVASGLREIRRAGYAKLVRAVRNGQVAEWRLLVSDSREFAPNDDVQDLELTDGQEPKAQIAETHNLDNPRLENQSLSKNEESKNEYSNNKEAMEAPKGQPAHRPVEQDLALNDGSSLPPKASSPRPPSLPPEAELWNKMCPNLSQVIRVVGERAVHLQARRKDPYWVANFATAVRKVSESDYCNGRTGNTWKAKFDFLLNEASFIKVMEGTYDNRGGPVRPAPTGEKDILLAALR